MSADNASSQTSTTSTFVSALVVGLITVAVLSVFLVWAHSKEKYRRVYQPRLELAPADKKPRALPTGFVSWWKTILFETPDTDIIAMNGLDAYLFVRFLKVFGLVMIVPMCVLSFLICIPMSAYKPNNGNSGLNAVAFGNVPSSNQARHVGHFLVEVILIVWVLYLIYREYSHLAIMRQQWLSSEYHLQSASSRTVMLVNVPKEKMSEAALREMSNGDGEEGSSRSGSRMVWLARKTKNVDKVFQDRNKECLRLEAAEAKIQKLAAKNVDKGKVAGPSGPTDSKTGAVPGANGATANPNNNVNIDPENRTNLTEALMDKYLTPKQKKKKTTWKQGFLGLFGAKMDFKSSPAYIRGKNEELEQMRAKENELEYGNVAFIRFPTQLEAHRFARTITKQKGNMMVQSGIEVHPDDIIWANTAQSPYQRKVGAFLGIALVVFLIVMWIPITVFIGSIVSLTALCRFSFLAWFCDDIPNVAQGVIQGVLPGALLSIELALVAPIVKLILNKLSKVPRHSDIEIQTFNRYCAFVFIHGFLITALSSGLLAALTSISASTISDIPQELATNLPGSGIFFLVYTLSSSWSGAAKSSSRAIPFLMNLASPILLGGTPRKRYAGLHKMVSFSFGVLGPSVCLLVILAIVYAVIQPILLLVGLVAFALLYAAYKYLLVYAADQPEYLETGGQIHQKYLNAVFVGVYISEILVCALLFLATDSSGGRPVSCVVCGALTAVLIALTAVFNFYLNNIAFNRRTMFYSSASLMGGSAATTKLQSSNTDTDAYNRVGDSAAVLSTNRAFDDRCLWQPMNPLWIPKDTLGFGNAEADRLTDENLDVSTRGAYMDTKGKLTVDRPPPEEDSQDPEQM